GLTLFFMWTVFLIGLESFVIGFLQSSFFIGLFSPLILAACRLIQVFSFGGELIAAVILF
ncbi:MFS transporter, partial [Francisella tularensis subsp. holarctica]|nr:MFS transporter [Francisella tularensis subsp. holarctica]